MERRDDAVLLALARERGLISEADLRRAAGFASLVAEGVLSEADASELRRAASSSAPSGDMPSEETLPLPPLPAGHASEPAHGDLRPEVAGAFRYQLLGELGQGAMGRVFKAHDPVLDRFVAVKLLFGDDPARVARFLNEARAQARVDHPHVCQVYEAGVTEGRPFIAMQLIEGATLGSAARDMTLEQRVRALKEVAEGVHAAHRTGLIHRDLKPTNMMVEMEEGAFRPYVLDFGLARDLGAEGLTATGQTVGTPAYMSPEQARGDVGNTDRRTDVYGLCATLYELLTGRPPFTGASAVEIMMKLVAEEPTPLRKVRDTIPADLETIVLKGLEKDPSRRYDSARALAEDLGRFLDGEVVLARPSGLATRVLKRVRKNPATSAALGASLVVVLAAAAVAVWSLVSAKERARVAQRFGQDVSEIEAIARYAALAPPHDTRPDRKRIRSRMAAIETRMKPLGRAGEGPGQYALGRGALALRDLEAARDRLLSSAALQPGSAETSYSLGVTLGLLYQRERETADALRSAELRSRRRKELDDQYRLPAVARLRESRRGGSSPHELSDALLAFYERRFADALALAEQAAKATPWLHEAKLLAADVKAAEAREADERADYATAEKAYVEAEALYRAAIRIGESDVRGWDGLGSLLLSAMLMRLNATGQDLAPLAARVEESVAGALVLDPERPAPLVKRSSALFLLGQAASRSGQDPTGLLTRSKEAAGEALRRDGGDVPALMSLGSAFRAEAENVEKQGKDPRPACAGAIEAYEKALARGPNVTAYNNLGVVLYYVAGYERSRGEDPRPAVLRADRYLAEALRIDPRAVNSLNNVGVAWLTAALYEMSHGLDARASLQRSAAASRKAVEISPNAPYPLMNLALPLVYLGLIDGSEGGDGFPALDEAEGLLKKAIAIHPKLSLARFNMADLCVNRAALKLDLGIPVTDFADAESALYGALALDPTNALGQSMAIRLHATQARAFLARGQDPAPAVAKASEAYEALRKISPDYPAAPLLMAYAALWGAAYGDRPLETVARVRTLAEKAIELDRDSPEPLVVLGQIETLATRNLARRGADPSAAAEKARAALEAGRTRNPRNAEIHAWLAQVHRWTATYAAANGRPIDDEVKKGVAAAEEALRLNPRYPEAKEALAALAALRALKR